MKKISLMFLLLVSIEIQNNIVFSHFYTGKTEFVLTNPNKDEKKLNKDEKKLISLWRSVVKVESNNGRYLFNEIENAIGVSQIRPIMIEEVNQILGYNKYSHEQAWDSITSFNIFKDFQKHFNPDFDLERGSRLWNGGRSGMEKESTLSYYEKILIYENI